MPAHTLPDDQRTVALLDFARSAVHLIQHTCSGRFFSTPSRLPATPTCEHGHQQRWCNRTRAADGYMCADIQVPIDLAACKSPPCVRCDIEVLL